MLLIVGTVIFGIFIISQLENKTQMLLTLEAVLNLSIIMARYILQNLYPKEINLFRVYILSRCCPIDVQISNFIDKSSYVTDDMILYL